ncbi:MAG TPA: hypothetical protein VFI33_02450, partial [Puia sp.]|nr:hypothetical protein [Puia sp.]
ESAETPEETTVLQPHVVPHKKHTVSGLIKEMWPAYLIEIIVIILGISITLAFEEWRDNSRENHLEQIYLKNLQTDIGTDLTSLGQAISGTDSLLQKGNELLAYTRSPDNKNIPPDKVHEDVRAILGRPNFFTSDASFTDLKSSGNLHLIKDIHLKNLLFAYYNETQHIKEVQDAERQATIILSGAYFLKQIPIDPMRSQSIPMTANDMNGLLKNIEFDNNVLLRVLNRKELLDIYQRTDSLAELLHNELLKKIGNSE